MAHVDPAKTETVSNLDQCKDTEQEGWMSLQSERYFLKKSATGVLGSPALLQKLGVQDGKARRVRWDHASQTLEVLGDSSGGRTTGTGTVLGLDQKVGFHKMDDACSVALRKALKDIVVMHALHL